MYVEYLIVFSKQNNVSDCSQSRMVDKIALESAEHSHIHAYQSISFITYANWDKLSISCF